MRERMLTMQASFFHLLAQKYLERYPDSPLAVQDNKPYGVILISPSANRFAGSTPTGEEEEVITEFLRQQGMNPEEVRTEVERDIDTFARAMLDIFVSKGGER
ncbi:MAG: hypothetical protein PHX93_04235 [Candidatus Peribacteraceae bacterium]|nr:hypothetical protein [Candidatus Peribacteraceae bacterium]